MQVATTVIKKNRRDSIRAISLPRVKAMEGLENITKDYDMWHNVHSLWVEVRETYTQTHPALSLQ